MQIPSASPFQYAITRRPGATFAQGITTANLGAPDLHLALAQHAAYVEALRQQGLNVIELPADEAYPDGCFVEDTAVVVPELAVISHPGADSRKGETAAIAEALAPWRSLAYLNANNPKATLDGGDVLRVGLDVFIGLSERTNEAGAAALSELLSPFGYRCQTIRLQGDILHLKTGVSKASEKLLLVSKGLNDARFFPGYELLETLPQEDYAANSVWVNGTVFLAAGYPVLRGQLQEKQIPVVELEVSEFRKMDGGLTCLSILF